MQHAACCMYAPLLDTLRLYAGWLLGWYALLLLLGGEHAAGRLPVTFDWAQNIAASALVLRFSFATFLFLMLSSMHRALKGGMVMGLMLTVLWVALVGVFSVLSA